MASVPCKGVAFGKQALQQTEDFCPNATPLQVLGLQITFFQRAIL